MTAETIANPDGTQMDLSSRLTDTLISDIGRCGRDEDVNIKLEKTLT